MRNFSPATVNAEEVFNSSYETALAWGRSAQAKENKRQESGNADSVISYTIEGEPGGEGRIIKHTGILGGQPPYQPILHKAD